MARFNEILVGRYNRFLQKLMGMKGGPPSPQLASEITAALTLFNGVENRYLEQWDRFGINQLQAAVAAQTSRIQYRNPVGSNVIAVFEKLIVGSNVAADQPTVNQGAATTDLATDATTSVQVLDPRGRTASTLRVSRQAAAGGGVGLAYLQLFFAANVQVDVIFFEDQEIPLLPGQALQIASNNVNTALIVGAIWRERFLEDSERA
jgi:hypothetical protein